MNRILSFAAIALLVGGCFRTTTYSDEQSMPLAEGLADSLIMSVSIEVPVKGAKEEVLANFEKGILSAAFDLEEIPGDVVETAERYEDNLKDEYFNEYEGSEDAGVRSWEDLPEAARRYVEFIEAQIGCHIRYVSVGAERDAYFVR